MDANKHCTVHVGIRLLTTNCDIKLTGQRQHLSNAVLKLFYLIGASLNICK